MRKPKPKVADLSPEELKERRRYHREYKQTYRHTKRPDLLYRYGITFEDKEALLASQGGVCAICSGHADNVDHCHTTGVVRGILCRACNTALGSFRDSPALLHKAVAYLERTSCQ